MRQVAYRRRRESSCAVLVHHVGRGGDGEEEAAKKTCKKTGRSVAGIPGEKLRRTVVTTTPARRLSGRHTEQEQARSVSAKKGRKESSCAAGSRSELCRGCSGCC